MTTQKHLKARVRSRMSKTGERYAAAHAHVVAAAGRAATNGAGTPGAEAVPAPMVNGIRHFPGIHPETTVARILASHAGVRDVDGRTPSEELLLAAGGGLGAGVFAFHYAKDDFSSLYLAGRHSWEEPLAFIEGALRRLGLEPRVRETGSSRTADRDLREALEAGGPVAAWVDWVELGTRGRPAEGSGGAYHVVAVYGVDGDTATIGDLDAEPVDVPLDVLARARARITKHRNRLLTVAPAAAATTDVLSAGRAGLHAGAEALATKSRRNFSLRAFEDLADRMAATSGAASWAAVFPRGRHLWTGLSSLHRFVETYFTGGGLLRPMASRAAAELGLDDVAARYTDVGGRWSALAQAALPDDVPLLAETRRAAEAADPGAGVEPDDRWTRLARLADEAAADFPLSEAQARDLLADLSARLREILAAEVAALDAVRAATA